MDDACLSPDEAAALHADDQAWEKFLYVLDWLLALQARYAASLRHSLVCVRFHDEQTQIDTHGARITLNMVVSLAREIGQALRRTDLVARDGTTIWALIPFVTPETVLSKVAQIVDIAADQGLNIVDRDLSVFSVPDAGFLERLEFEGAREFLDLLADQKLLAVRWEHVLKPLD
jgi:hypothetical protein